MSTCARSGLNVLAATVIWLTLVAGCSAGAQRHAASAPNAGPASATTLVYECSGGYSFTVRV